MPKPILKKPSHTPRKKRNVGFHEKEDVKEFNKDSPVKYSQGVNNVILVDFTCSHCDYGRPDDRTVRRIRRKHGGRKKKTLKKNISKNKTRNRPKKNYL
jgi:hypothetical protein